MARQLVPLKVKIGLRPNGQAKYPDFNSLAIVTASGKDWAKYVDIEGDGWHYDKKSGHKDDDAQSPVGTQWGVLLVPQAFADEAVVAFPAKVQIILEAEWETFYDNRAHAHEEDEEIDLGRLRAIEQKQRLSLPLTTQQQDAIDPAKDERGIRKNKRRKWADYKAQKGITIPVA